MDPSAPRALYLLRHAKAEEPVPGVPDRDRALTGRGRRDAPRMGRWLAEHERRPEVVLSSPAKRARQTARRAVEAMDLDPRGIRWDERLYGATVEDLRAVLGAVPGEVGSVLLVGHNPGLEDLVRHLARGPVEPGPDGKVLPTCAVACLDVPGAWADLRAGEAHLRRLQRPRDVEA